jgi:hypothetical protein
MTWLRRPSATKPQGLHKIAADLPTHITALRFVRVVLETLSAVLITLAVAQWLGSGGRCCWWRVAS